ncbi:MAG: hypothetical protein FJ009_22435 [Chloroflexi bacterium]|nr:hypothetical protein [Chloroflexota bacterium]
MIEHTRVKTKTILQASALAVRKNVDFWNGLHQLGLSKHIDTLELTIWGVGNCILASRQVSDATTEVHLIVAYRQRDYVWVNGLHPDAPARASWNHLRTLWMEVRWGQHIAYFEDQRRRISDEMERLAERDPPYDDQQLLKLAQIRLRVPYLHAEQFETAIQAEWQKLRQGIEQAKTFKQAQMEIADLTTEQIAGIFAAMFPTDSGEPSPEEEGDDEDEGGCLESKILQARQALLDEDLPDTDANIAARLPPSRKGHPYTREWINRVRNRMRRRGIEV